MLARIAAEVDGQGLADLVESLQTPLRVGVHGRSGAGCRTVARVLRRAGVSLAGQGAAAEVHVQVVAETLKPEDRAFLGASAGPRVVVLNKADVAGFGGRGPLAAAAEQCRRIQDETGIPAYPLAGLLAVAGFDSPASDVDGEAIDALRALATDPADLGSVDGFVSRPHRVAMAVRVRLLATLDLFGIALATVVVRQGGDREAVIAAVRLASGVDALLAAIERAGSEVRYQRILDTAVMVAKLFSGPGGDRFAELMAGDDVVLARMSAAADVLSALGLVVEDDDLLRQANKWQVYSRGPVSALHRECGVDVARGSLRLWSRSGGIPEPAR